MQIFLLFIIVLNYSFFTFFLAGIENTPYICTRQTAIMPQLKITTL